MGYRLHYAPHYAPDWQGGAFNHASEEWNALFYDKFNENGWINEDGDQCEVFRDDLEKYISDILKHPRTKNEYFKEYTNKEVAEELTEVLRSEDEFIRLEWF